MAYSITKDLERNACNLKKILCKHSVRVFSFQRVTMAPSSANLATTSEPTTIAGNLTTVTYATTNRPPPIYVTEYDSGQHGGVTVVGWYNTTPPPETVYYYYWDYSFYILLVFILLLCVPLMFIKMAMRKRQQAARQVVLQRQQARRQAEINITYTGGNCNGGNSTDGTANPTNNNATDQIDISILPKDYDLPPAYDELILEHPNCKEQLKAGENLGSSATIANAVSTVTIATELEGSCNSLAATTNNTIAEHSV